MGIVYFDRMPSAYPDYSSVHPNLFTFLSFLLSFFRSLHYFVLSGFLSGFPLASVRMKQTTMIVG
jgi:hypothetical protein